MPILDLFFKRQKRARGEMPDVYQYDDVPEPLRVQVVQLLMRALPDEGYASLRESTAAAVVNVLRLELGRLHLTGNQFQRRFEELANFILSASPEEMLSAVEVAFAHIPERICEHLGLVDELNGRFREAGVGYQLENWRIMRIDSQFIHAEAVKPALQLLSSKNYEGANEEFLNAHSHYRHKHYKAAITEACKAFESTLKAICEKRGWRYDKDRDTAKTLIKIVTDNGLLPDFLDGQVGTLRALLENGVPTCRNRRGGHGQGSKPVEVPEHFARYVLNLTATTIVFLVESEAADG